MNSLKLIAIKLFALDQQQQSRFLANFKGEQKDLLYSYVTELSSRFSNKDFIKLDFSRFKVLGNSNQFDIELEGKFQTYSIENVLAYLSSKPSGQAKVLISLLLAENKNSSYKILSIDKIKAYGSVSDFNSTKIGLKQFVFDDFEEFVNDKGN